MRVALPRTLRRSAWKIATVVVLDPLPPSKVAGRVREWAEPGHLGRGRDLHRLADLLKGGETLEEAEHAVREPSVLGKGEIPVLPIPEGVHIVSRVTAMSLSGMYTCSPSYPKAPSLRSSTRWIRCGSSPRRPMKATYSTPPFPNHALSPNVLPLRAGFSNGFHAGKKVS